MTRARSFVLITLIALTAPAFARAAEWLDPATAKPDGNVLFFDIRPLGIEGQGWSDVQDPFDRLPAKAKGVVRDRVWELSKNSAGLCVRFFTNATTLHARWTTTSPTLAMSHMPATGMSGVDLYVRMEDKWRWLAVGQPKQQSNSVVLVKDLPPGTREYLLYLPLYNGVKSVEIGAPKDAKLGKAHLRPADKSKPIVFYGTSITQGGCASRPGMCHPAILGRRFDWPVINLGFSGNGKMEPEVANLLAELDPAVYVIDCIPNMTGDVEGISQRAPNLVKTIRAKHPTTPILLVEDRTYADAFLQPKRAAAQAAGRKALRQVYDALVGAGDKNLAYLEGDTLLAADGESTVDSSHPTDLGFVQHADAFEPVLRKLLTQAEH
jgi:hypothetical protein